MLDRFHIAIALMLIPGMASSAQAIEGKRNHDIERQSTILFENDDLTLDDGGYTNGLAYSWSYGSFDRFEDRTPAWMEMLTGRLYIATMPEKQRRISYSVAQEIYTPEEIKIPVIDPNDRPYAGLITWQATWLAFDDRIVDRLGLELGMVGSVSLGEHTQKAVHKLTGANEPKNWDEQLENEPIFRLSAQRSWRLHEGLIGNMEYDVVGHAHGSGGTRRSDLGAGVSLRFGRGLQRNLVSASLNPAREVNLSAGHPGEWYGFVALGGDYVFNDITLDGNTFESSASVDLEHWQAATSVGAVWNMGNLGWLLSVRYITDEFETQQKDSIWGSVSVSYRFKPTN